MEYGEEPGGDKATKGRQAWTCLKTFREKFENDPASDTTPTLKRKFLKSPCFAKLKFRRNKKNNIKENIELDSEMDEMKNNHTSNHVEGISFEKKSDDDAEVPPNKRAMSEKQHFNNSHIRTGSLRKKRTLSKNLIDLEDEMDVAISPYSKHTTQVYEAEIPSKNPFSNVEKNMFGPEKRASISGLQKVETLPNKISNPRKQQSYKIDVDRDFKRTRNLFENIVEEDWNKKNDENAINIKRSDRPVQENINKEDLSRLSSDCKSSKTKEGPVPTFLKNYGC